MPKHFSFVAVLLCAWLWFSPSAIQAQAQNSPPADTNQLIIPAEKEAAPEHFLPDSFGEWRATGATKVTAGEATAKLSNGEVLQEYGIHKVASRVYHKGTDQLTVEVFGAHSQAGAYGLYTFILDGEKSRQLHAGRYCVNVWGNAYPNDVFFSAIKSGFAELGSRTPALVEKLPQQQAARPVFLYSPKTFARYKQFDFLKDTLSFIGGTEVAITRYPNGNGQMDLLLAEFQTPQLATDGLVALQAQYDGLPQAEKDRRLVKRIGNYVAIAANVQDRVAAESLVKQIKYEMKVYWEGKKYNDIPLEYRGPDTLALAEASQTAGVILRAFYWIGIMLVTTIGLGIISGGAFFYWRRYQRRKLGLENIFSDAGGSVRLNLDDYLLEAGTEKKKLPEKTS